MANIDDWDKDRGIYQKFTVERKDGRDRPGKPHDGCQYFVLDLNHDPFAGPALVAYANACLDIHPKLATDCYKKGREIEMRTEMERVAGRAGRRIKREPER